MEQQPKKEPTEFEMKTIAMKLAIQHHKGCQLQTLIKIAKGIYNFLTGKQQEDEKI